MASFRGYKNASVVVFHHRRVNFLFSEELLHVVLFCLSSVSFLEFICTERGFLINQHMYYSSFPMHHNFTYCVCFAGLRLVMLLGKFASLFLIHSHKYMVKNCPQFGGGPQLPASGDSIELFIFSRLLH